MAVDAERVTAIESGAFREGFDSFYRREVSAVVGLAFVLSNSRSGGPRTWLRRVFSPEAVREPTEDLAFAKFAAGIIGRVGEVLA